MMTLNEIMTQMQKNIEDNYYFIDGEKYCKKCKTKVKPRIIQTGLMILPPIDMCDCEYEKRKKEEKENSDKEKQEFIKSQKENSFKDTKFLSYTFENAKEDKQIINAKKYCQEWEKVKENNIGILYWGNVGTGKTYLATCITNKLINDYLTTVEFTSFNKILIDLTNFKDENRFNYLEKFRTKDLVVIDDLGVERQSDYALEQIFSVIDIRYKSNKPTIITTNLTLAEIKNPSDIKYKRIYDRILEMCVPIKVEGESKRNNKEKRELIKKIFEN